MTDPVFGRATPIHFTMLELACWQDPEPEDDLFDPWGARTRDEKLRQMVQARADLYYLTGEDFGFSLRDWRAFLIGRGEQGEEDFGYGHPYAAHRVDRAILDVISDPERSALERAAEEAQETIEPVPRAWWRPR